MKTLLLSGFCLSLLFCGIAASYAQPREATPGMTSSPYQENKGMNNVDLNFIDTKILAYMNKHDIPGLSMAITKEERLVFAKGYGYANQDTEEPVNTSHLFRIASISKPITAVAIMKLIEDGKLSLDRKVFGAGGIFGAQYGTKPYSDPVKMITVQHLLEHTSGWSNDCGDPMFMNLAFNHSALIGWVLDNRPLKNEPGTKYDYLNFGYCLLGRIIEKVTGQSYESYVQNNILSRCGISKMEIGGDMEAARKPNEVVYYGPIGYPYGLKATRMDSHGGWIASPTDLLRFMVRTDDFAAKPDILQPATIKIMFKGSSVNPYYGKGWRVYANHKRHGGAMPGTSGDLVRRDDGFCFAVLVNIWPLNDREHEELDKVMNEIVNGVSNWPGYDLF
jgi:CubicO group peptidase (beta-lactamase class C family)